jgi:hypothetical protein
MPDNSIANTIDYVTAVVNAIIAGRIEAKEFQGMTPEQKTEYIEKLVTEEKAEIEKGLDRHKQDQ